MSRTTALMVFAALAVIGYAIFALWAWRRLPARWAAQAGLPPKETVEAELKHREGLSKALAFPVAVLAAAGTIVTVMDGIRTYREAKEQAFWTGYKTGLADLTNADGRVRMGSIYTLRLLCDVNPERASVIIPPMTYHLRSQAPAVEDPDKVCRSSSRRRTDSSQPASVSGVDRLEMEAALSALSMARVRSKSQSLLDLSCLDLNGVDAGGSVLFSASAVLADLSSADLSRSDLRGSDLYRSKLVRAVLEGVDLSGANLTGADFQNARLDRATLRAARNPVVPFLHTSQPVRVQGAGADFSNASLLEASLQCAFLPGAKFVHAKLPRADLSGADIYEARFEGASLVGANLTYANAAKADFSRANLGEARFDHAKLEQATFHEAKWETAIFQGACGITHGGPELPPCEADFEPYPRECPRQADLVDR